MSIESQLAAFGKTKKFKELVGKSAANGELNKGGKLDKAEKEIVDDIIEDIYIAVNTRINKIQRNAFRVNKVGRNNNTGVASYYVSFRPEAVHRNSLYKKGYPKGLQNIVSLLSGGFTKEHENGIRDTVFGEDGAVPKGWKPVPDPFLRNAIDALNKKYNCSNIKIILSDEYYPHC